MKVIALALIVVSCAFLSGCAGLVVVGAATGAAVSQDRRTVPTQLEDQNIEMKSVLALFENDEIWRDTHIDMLSYNNNVLLVGQAPTAKLKEKAQRAVENIARVKKVFNQIRIAAPISFFARRNDEYLTSKVKSSMLFAEEFSSGKVKVITENSEVFLVGLVSEEEANQAAEIARNIDGVTRVVKAFEIIKIAH